jgi:transposase
LPKEDARVARETVCRRIALGNNRAENAIRPFVISRKNSFFCDTVAGTQASANLYSMIETAAANGLEPHAYLARTFTELPNAQTVDDIEKLLPFTSSSAQEWG